MLLAIFKFISDIVIPLLVYILFASVVLQWLMLFNVVNRYNAVVQAVAQTLAAITEPMLRPIRRWVPPIRGVDISPLILFLALLLLSYIIHYAILPSLQPTGV